MTRDLAQVVPGRRSDVAGQKNPFWNNVPVAWNFSYDKRTPSSCSCIRQSSSLPLTQYNCCSSLSISFYRLSPMAGQADFNAQASRKGKSNEFSLIPRLSQNCSSRTLDHPVDDTALMRYRWDRWNNRGSYWILRAGLFFRNMLANSLAPWCCASLVSVSIVKLFSPRILRLLVSQLECVSDLSFRNLKSILWPPGLDVTESGMGGRFVGKYLI